MKLLFVILCFLFPSCSLFAQSKDTLVVPLGKYDYIKIGDKVYKINTSLDIAPPEIKYPYTISTSDNFYRGGTILLGEEPNRTLIDDKKKK